MTALCFLLLAAQSDIVHTRDGRRIDGRLLEYDRFVELERADGTKPRILRSDIARIELTPAPLRCPEVVPFPFDQLEKPDNDYLSFRNILVVTSRPPGKKVAGLNVLTGKKVWELEVPRRAAVPALAGRTLYLMESYKEEDETRKIKFGAATVPKEIWRLVVTAVDVETGQSRWTITLDNNDRKDMHWEFVPNPTPSVYVIPDRVVIRSVRQGYPMDGTGTIDKGKGQKWVNFSVVDPERKKVIQSVDSIDAAQMGGKPFFTEDAVVTQLFQAGQQWKLASFAREGGKVRWQTELIPGKLFDVFDDYAWLSDQGAQLFTGISVRNGKRHERVAVDLSVGAVADVDTNYAYLYRTKKAPRAIIGIDLRRGTEAWKIEMPEREDYFHLLLAGHRLLYVDRMNVLRAFDTLARKEIWSWTGPGVAFFQNPQLQGNGLSFYKDGRVVLLDVNTGRKHWEVRLPYRAIAQIGDVGLMAQKTIGHDLIRQRTVPPGGSFFAPADTPLRYALGDDAWSPPAVEGGILYSLSSGGQLAAIDLKDRSLKWMKKVSPTPILPPSAPAVRDGRLAACTNQEMVVFDMDAQVRHYAVRHTPRRIDRLAEFYDSGALTTTGSSFSLSDFATGKRVWEAKPRSVLAYEVSGDRAYVVTVGDLQVINLKSGETETALAIPRGVTHLATDGSKVVVATGPYGFGETQAGADFAMRFRSKEQDPKIAQKFRGALALAGGNVIYAHAEGKLVGFEGATDKALWSVDLPGFVGGMMVHGDRVWLTAPGYGLLGLNVKDGSVAWKQDLSDAASFVPILHQGKVAFWSMEGWLITPAN